MNFMKLQERNYLLMGWLCGMTLRMNSLVSGVETVQGLFTRRVKVSISMTLDKIVGKENPLNENSVTTLKWRPMNNTNNKVLATGDSEGTF